MIRTKENRRQGGARNEGVLHAKGDWIVFIDQDDWWDKGALQRIFDFVGDKLESLDMVMVDHFYHRGKSVCDKRYAHNSSSVYTGMEFLKHEELTWAPWGYLFRRKFLLDNGLKFEEHVRFEDADFAIRSISYAKGIMFCPVSLVHYTTNEDSQTAFGHDTRDIIEQMMMHNCRIYNEFLRINEIDKEAGKIIYMQASFAFKCGSRRLIWLNFSDVLYLIRKYFKGRFSSSDGAYLWFASKSPFLFTCAIFCASPLLTQIVKSKHR